METKPLIYIAGPLFTEGERWLLEGIDKLCKNTGYKTFLPHRDAGLFDRASGKSSRKFYEADERKIISCNLMVAVLNGTDVDSGTANEIDSAHQRKKPVIGYVNDYRIYNPLIQINPRVINQIDEIARDFNNLEKILKEYRPRF